MWIRELARRQAPPTFPPCQTPSLRPAPPPRSGGPSPRARAASPVSRFPGAAGVVWCRSGGPALLSH